MSAFRNIGLSLFGASRAETIGIRMRGFPSGFRPDRARLLAFLSARRATSDPDTPRREADLPVFVSGLADGVTTSDMTAVIRNVDVADSDPAAPSVPRPSHADCAMLFKTGEILPGGGKFSGRMTAAICVAGGIAEQMLDERGIFVGAYATCAGKIRGISYADRKISRSELAGLTKTRFALSNADAMAAEISLRKSLGDSVGGIAECIVFGAPRGLGDAYFDRAESRLASALFSLPSLKSVEFGLGRGFGESLGSATNDELYFDRNGEIRAYSNNCGGITGGVTNGEDILMRLAFKPVPSISLPQRSVDLSTGRNSTLRLRGRFDACVIPRILPAVRSLASLAILDMLLDARPARAEPDK